MNSQLVKILCIFIFTSIHSVANATLIGDEVTISAFSTHYSSIQTSVVSATDPEFVYHQTANSWGYDSNLEYIEFTTYVTTTIDLGGPEADVVFSIDYWHDHPDVYDCLGCDIPWEAAGAIATDWGISSLNLGGDSYIAGFENIVDPINIISAGPVTYPDPTTVRFISVTDMGTGTPGPGFTSHLSAQFDFVLAYTVPTPSTIALMGLGLIGLALVGRKKEESSGIY